MMMDERLFYDSARTLYLVESHQATGALEAFNEGIELLDRTGQGYLENYLTKNELGNNAIVTRATSCGNVNANELPTDTVTARKKPTPEGRVMSTQNMPTELVRLPAENEALRQVGKTGSLPMKVSEKGAVSVYCLGRFPVTLYQEQWLKLLAMADQIKQFIEDKRGRLKVKE
jgi:hypothetical protein